MIDSEGSLVNQLGESNTKYNIAVKCEVFFITDNETAARYAELLTKIKNNPNYSMVETESTWNQDGELTKVITYEIKEKVKGDE